MGRFSKKNRVITEQIQIISHSRRAAFASGYMKSLAIEIAKMATEDNLTFAYGADNIIEYSVNLAPHQSNYIHYEQSGSINVNISHFGDPLSGNDAIGNVINIHSNVDTTGGIIHQHGTRSFSSELNGVLNILKNKGNKESTFLSLKQFYQKWDSSYNSQGQKRFRGISSSVKDGR